MAGDVVIVHDQLPPLVERSARDPLVREHAVQRLAHSRVAQQRFAVLVAQDLDDTRGRAHDRPLLAQWCERAVNVVPVLDARRIDDAVQFRRLGHVHRPLDTATVEERARYRGRSIAGCNSSASPRVKSWAGRPPSRVVVCPVDSTKPVVDVTLRWKFRGSSVVSHTASYTRRNSATVNSGAQNAVASGEYSSFARARSTPSL